MQIFATETDPEDELRRANATPTGPLHNWRCDFPGLFKSGFALRIAR